MKTLKIPREKDPSSERANPEFIRKAGKGENTMAVSESISDEDIVFFYDSFFPLINYVNNERNVLGRKTTWDDHPKNINPDDAFKVAKELWSHTSMIDDYLKLHPELPEDARDLVASWKRAIHDTFFVDRILKKGAVFLYDEEAFIVKSLNTPWEELLGMYGLPSMIETTLLPFRDVIIYDSLFLLMPLLFGGGAKKLFRGEYQKARRAGKVRTSL